MGPVILISVLAVVAPFILAVMVMEAFQSHEPAQKP